MACRIATVLLLGFALLVPGCDGPATAGSSHRDDSRVPDDPLFASSPVAIASDDGGAIAEWVLAISGGRRDEFLPTLVEIIMKAAPDISFRILTSGVDPRPDLVRRLEARGFRQFHRLRWSPVRSEVSWWTRDFFVAGRTDAGAPVAILHHPEHYESVQHRVRGSGEDLITALREGLSRQTVESQARLDGGAVVAADRHVFITPAACKASVEAGGFEDWADLIEYLRRLYRRPVVVLDVPVGWPWDHSDIYLTPVGPNRLLLGDPGLAAELVRATPAGEIAGFATRLAGLAAANPHVSGLAGADASMVRSLVRSDPSPETRRVLRQLCLLGYRVKPLPLLALRVPGVNGDVHLSWNNVILERRKGMRTVYLPTYGLATLDRAARDIFEMNGCDVVEIEALAPALFGGSVRCLSQVFRR